jgi:general secretion pathway protein M
MMSAWRERWHARRPRERWVLMIMAVIVGVVLYLWGLVSAFQARDQLMGRMPILKRKAAQVEQQAAEYLRLRNTPPDQMSKTDLRLLIQAQAGVAGLTPALTRIESPDPNHVEVLFDNVPFSQWLVWVDRLQSLHARLDNCKIEASEQPGQVKVAATFTRSM